MSVTTSIIEYYNVYLTIQCNHSLPFDINYGNKLFDVMYLLNKLCV